VSTGARWYWLLLQLGAIATGIGLGRFIWSALS